ncbi:hypothetical protein A3K70_00950 [Candidatus Bathyarchaeota archaeon RBG_16_48_13]|nr:MAG: hypothetical protein A3K70_00950 [Candidatus Bathyarchaeota archaeon RBG_16_48_13]
MLTPIRTYMSKHGGRLKDVAFFRTGDSNDNDIFPEMEALCGKNPVAMLMLHRRKGVENGGYSEKTG